MSESLENVRRLLDQCTIEEQAALLDYLKARLPQHPLEKALGVSADVILSAISRSTDLTKRGVRGIIAEAIFERHVLAALEGWEAVAIVGDHPYDFLITSKVFKPQDVRIQVKLQRMKTQRADASFRGESATIQPTCTLPKYKRLAVESISKQARTRVLTVSESSISWQ